MNLRFGYAEIEAVNEKKEVDKKIVMCESMRLRCEGEIERLKKVIEDHERNFSELFPDH